MVEHFEYVLRRRGEKEPVSLSLTAPEEAEKTSRFHSGLPGYTPTPLVELDGLAGKLGAPQPAWFKKAVSALQNGIDHTGDKLDGEE